METFENFWLEQMTTTPDAQGVMKERTNPRPIDKSSVFLNKESAISYALVNGTSYPGLIIAVAEGTKLTVYVLDSSNDVSATGLRRVGVLSACELCGMNEYFKLTADNVASGTNVLNLISIGTMSSDFNLIKLTLNNELSLILDKLDDSPYVIEVAVRTNEIISYAELTGYPYDDFDATKADGEAIANVLSAIKYKIVGHECESPKNYDEMKEICDSALSALPMSQNKSNLEFRLLILRKNDSIIMNQVLILSANLAKKVSDDVNNLSTELMLKISDICNRLDYLETKLQNKVLVTEP